MRTIHRVRFHEKFVASGIYTCYDLDKQPQPNIFQKWSIHEQPDGGQIIRVDMERDGTTLFHLWRENTTTRLGRIEILDLYRGERITSTFEFEAQTVNVIWKVGEKPAENAAIDLPLNCLIYLVDVNVILGDLLRQIDASGGISPVIEIISPRRRERRWSVYEMQARLIGEAKNVFQEAVQGTAYAYLDDHPRIWLNEQKIVVQHDTHDDYSWVLTQYAHRPEVPITES